MTEFYPSLDALACAVGSTLGVSNWRVIDQPMVDQFARLTGDSQWIHVDSQRAKHGPYGTTVVHGYFTVSLLVPMIQEIFEVGGLAMGINYGLNKVRFPAAVPVGSRVRATMRLQDLTESERGSLAVLHTTVEADGIAKPVCVAELVVLLIPDESLTTTTP